MYDVLFDLVDNVDLYSFRYCHLATAKLNKFNKIKSVGTRGSAFGNSPVVAVSLEFVVLSSYRTRLDGLTT